jgi:Spy/CpxP family protein refolding chaperone
MKQANRWLAAAAISAALAFAQDQGPGMRQPMDPAQRIQMRVNFLANSLGLTDGQKTQATTIFTTANDGAQAARETAVNTRKTLNEAIKKNDTAAIDQASAAIGTATGQLTAIESKAEAAFYALLTPDQQTKYDNMRGPGMGSGMGPGGMRPQGGPPRNR